MQELLTSVILLGAAQGVVLAAVLFARENNRLANRILSGLVGSVSLMLLLGVLEKQWGFSSQPLLLGLQAPLPFLFAPLLYLYVTALTRPVARAERRWLAHALPFAAFVLYWLPAFYLKSGAEKIALALDYNAGRVAAPLPMRLFELLQLAQAIVYLAASWVALRRHARRMKGFFGDVARIDLRWLMAMVLANSAVWSIVILSGILRIAGFAPIALRSFSQAIQVGSVLVIFLTGYISLWQPELFEKATAAKAAEPPRRPLPKYQRNRLDEEEAAALARKVTSLMEEDELYRDAALTLEALATAVGASPHMLSQVLNLHLRKSFFVLVNSYRAEELMAALTDPARRSRGVLELALDAGFNSKSTVNSFFKRYTGMTPSEFRRSQSREKSPQISTG